MPFYFQNIFLNEEFTDELIKIIKIEKEVNRDVLIYKTGNKEKDKTYHFQKFKTINSFGREIYNGEIILEDALEEQINLKNAMDKLKESTEPQK